MMLIDLVGRRFGRLVVERRVENHGNRPVWQCMCDCGTGVAVEGGNLRQGNTQSCGCLHREMTSQKNKKHGMSSSTEYAIWNNMIERCQNPKNKRYMQYGGRGISVCERWLTFENFFQDMGRRPHKTTLERKEVDGNYEPNNCKWATAVEQARNTTANRIITFNGKTACLAQHCEDQNLNYKMVHQRLRRGWSIEKSLSLNQAA